MSERMRILVTGSRSWSDRDAVEEKLDLALERLGHPELPPILVHGKAAGADRIAEQIWISRGWPVEGHEAEWHRYPNYAAGPIRNKHMVGLGADICVAFPLGLSTGTRNCIELAKLAGIPVINIEGDDEDDDDTEPIFEGLMDDVDETYRG